MALEPEEITADSEPSAELLDMNRRFWLGLILALPVLILEMSSHFTRTDSLISPQVFNWIQLLLATPWCCGRDGHSSSVAGSPFYVAT